MVDLAPDPNKPATKIAVIGLGSMGFGIAESLIRARHEVAGYDVRPEVTARFAAGHGGRLRCAASPAEVAAGAGIIVVVVVNADQTAAVLLGEDGAVSAAPRGAVVVSCATMAPERARKLAREVTARSLLFLDAPISGGAQRAREGALTVLVSGSEAAFTAAAQALDAIAAKLYRLGCEPSIGSSFKIVNQLLVGVHIAAACEAIALAKQLGLDIAKVYEVIKASAGNSWMFKNRVPHILEGGYSPRSATSIFTKDLGIVVDIERAGTFPAPLSSAALQLFLMTAAAGMAHDDGASVVRLFARIAGLEVPAHKV